MRPKINSCQQKALGVLTVEYTSAVQAGRSPEGRQLDVKESGNASSDILISQEFVGGSNLNTCECVSLRKSLEITISDHLRRGVYGSKIEGDTDREAPHYLLHGWTESWDSTSDEVWTAHASQACWSALYSWSGQLSGNMARAIELHSCPEVLGYVYLLEVSNPEFYSNGSRISRFEPGSKNPNAPEHTAETDGKIFARYGYGKMFSALGYEFIPVEGPDAYIFKGKVMQEAKLEVLHTYRIMKPCLIDETEDAEKRDASGD